MKVSNEILQLVPYSPGKPIEETKREYNLTTVHKLASNENPLGPSPKVVAALQKALSEIHRYPDASFFDLRQAFSRQTALDPSWITFGNGSNELIDLLVRVYCEPGDSILTSQAAFVAYRICAQAARVKTVETPLTEDLKFDVDALLQKLEVEAAQRPKLLFLANPNNPTGTYLSREEIQKLMDRWGGNDELLIVIDEAYLEFVRADDYRPALEWVTEYSNVVVLRTMSKVYGLAGLRVGVMFARPEVITLIDRVRNPFNVNLLAQVAVSAALEDGDYLRKVQDVTWSGLDYFYAELSRLGLKYWPSQGNFVLFDADRDASAVFEGLLRRGVIMRPVKNYGFVNLLRLSVGLPHENEAAIQALEEVLKEVPRT